MELSACIRLDREPTERVPAHDTSTGMEKMTREEGEDCVLRDRPKREVDRGLDPYLFNEKSLPWRILEMPSPKPKKSIPRSSIHACLVEFPAARLETEIEARACPCLSSCNEIVFPVD